MCAILQLVSAPLNPIPIGEHFRRSHPQCEHSYGQHIYKSQFKFWLIRVLIGQLKNPIVRLMLQEDTFWQVKWIFHLFPCFSFKRKLFYKSNRNLFSCVCIAWYKHSRGWENSRQLCKPSTSSRVCINVSNSPNPSRVYIRLCEHGKRFLLLNYYTVLKTKKL